MVHVNTLKACVDREERVLRLTVEAESEEDGAAGGISLSQVCAEYREQDIEAIKSEFADVLSSEPGNTDSAILSLELVDSTPIQQAPYRVPDHLKPGVKKELEGLLEADIVAPSTSPLASPIVPVTKPDGSVRICVDYRKLNEVTAKDPYYMPTLEEILERVGHVMYSLSLT